MPVVLGDGATWLLSDGGLCNALDAVRDRLDDAARLSGKVDMTDVAEAAWIMIAANYDLAEHELARLVLDAGHKDLVKGVMEAFFGPDAPRRTYTAWAASALFANGIDPAKVPGELRPHVLDQLVQTGRAIPAEEYLESAVAARQFAAIRARAGIPPKAAT